MMVSKTAVNKLNDQTNDNNRSTNIVGTLFQDMKVYGKKVKKVADSAEIEIEKLDKQIKKVQKELKKADEAKSDNLNSKKIAKIKENELKLEKRRREKIIKVLSLLQNELQNGQEILTKLKTNVM